MHDDGGGGEMGIDGFGWMMCKQNVCGSSHAETEEAEVATEMRFILCTWLGELFSCSCFA